MGRPRPLARGTPSGWLGSSLFTVHLAWQPSWLGRGEDAMSTASPRVVSLGVLASLAACRTGAPAAQPAERGTVKLPGFDVPYVVEGAGRPCIVYGLVEYGRRAFSDRLKGELRCAYVQTRL